MKGSSDLFRSIYFRSSEPQGYSKVLVAGQQLFESFQKFSGLFKGSSNNPKVVEAIQKHANLPNDSSELS